MVYIQLLQMIFLLFRLSNSIHLYFLKRHWIICISNQFSVKWSEQSFIFIFYFEYVCASVTVSVWDCLLWLSYKLSLAIDSSLFGISLSHTHFLALDMMYTQTHKFYEWKTMIRKAPHIASANVHRLGNFMFFFVCLLFIRCVIRKQLRGSRFFCFCWYWCLWFLSLSLSAFPTIHRWDRYQLAFFNWFFSHNKNEQFIFERRRW